MLGDIKTKSYFRDAQYGFYLPDNYLVFMADTDQLANNFTFLYFIGSS